MALKKWKKVGKPEIVAQGYGKKFVKQKFLDHKNKETDFYFLETVDWATIFALTKDNKVLVNRQYKQGADDFMEELPAGVVEESDRNPEETIKRELLEETGYTPAEVISLGSVFANSRHSHSRAHYFLAKGCKKIKEPEFDDEEELETYEVELQDFVDKILNGEIINWDSYIITLRALKYLGVEVAIHDRKSS